MSDNTIDSLSMEWAPLVPELLVSNHQESMDFYVDTLGFRVRFTRDNPPFAYLETDESQLMIQEHRENDQWATGELVKPYGRGINLQIEVSSVSPYITRLERAGHQFYEEVQENWYRIDSTEYGNREFLIQDPDGYLLRFVEFIGRR